jgi:futalosine hydrolase
LRSAPLRYRPSVLLVVAATERELELVRGAETACCGVGPVEAALRTAQALSGRDVTAVLHIGIAGARTIEGPALVLGSESVYCDVIDEGSTFPRLERIAPDTALLAAVREALPEAHVAPISTSGRIGGGDDVEAMEGFGVLRAAQLAGVPAVELRAISNAVNEPDRTKWRFDDAFALLADAVARVVPVLR